MKTLTILGSTGSVGDSTLDVLRHSFTPFSVLALTAHQNVEKLIAQAREFLPKIAVIGDEIHFARLKEGLEGTGISCAAGRSAVIEAASMGADITMAAIMGMAGLEPILAAIDCGKRVAIANKEPLVAAGKIVLARAAASGAVLLPVDSEHNAVFQVFEQHNRKAIDRIILTASGGPFRTSSVDEMRSATRVQALKHPNWVMGAKITIDSATMMNKALEVIEAHHLFDLPAHQIDVLVHPQSVVHSMVEYADGSVLAQMGASDMRVPITYALAWPDRMHGGARKLDFATLKELTFEPVDHGRFPAINLAYRALNDGVKSCVTLSAANEIAVEAFLADRIGFMDIVQTVQEVLDHPDIIGHSVQDDVLDDILDFDHRVRRLTQTLLNSQPNEKRLTQ